MNANAPDPLGDIWNTFFTGQGLMPGGEPPVDTGQGDPPPPDGPDDVIPVAGDSEGLTAGGDDVVPVVGDSAGPTDEGGGATWTPTFNYDIQLPGGEDDWGDDELDDWLDWLEFGGEPPLGCGFWTFVALVLLVLAGGGIAGAIALTSGGSSPASTPPTTATTAPTTTTSAAAGNPFAGYYCHGAKQLVLIANSNGGAVTNGGSPPTFSTKGQPYCVTYIQTYHWNGGSGSAPGSVGLTHLSGGPAGLPKAVGPFTAKASSGQNNAPNVNWYADVPLASVIIDGTYACSDSEPSTWSSDPGSGGAGFCIVYAYHAYPPAAAATTTSG